MKTNEIRLSGRGIYSTIFLDQDMSDLVPIWDSCWGKCPGGETFNAAHFWDQALKRYPPLIKSPSAERMDLPWGNYPCTVNVSLGREA